MSSQIDELCAKQLQLENRIQELDSEKTREKDQLSGQIGELFSKHLQLENRIQKLESGATDAGKTTAEEEHIIEQLKKRNQELEKRNQELESEKTEPGKTIAGLEHRIVKLNEIRTSLESTIALHHRHELEQLNERIATAKQERPELEEALTAAVREAQSKEPLTAAQISEDTTRMLKETMEVRDEVHAELEKEKNRKKARQSD